MIRMVNETEKDLNINIRNFIQELNADTPDFMSTIGTKEPRDLHSNGKQQTGVDEQGKPIYTPVYGTGIRGTGIDIDASNKILEYFNQSDFNGLIDYWNKSVRDAIKECRSIIGNYNENNLILRKDKSVIIKDAANSFYANNEYVAPWKNFTNQNYLEARSDENLDVLTNDKYLDYTQSYNRNILNDMIDQDEESSDSTESLKSSIVLSSTDEKNPELFRMGIKNTNTGYSITLTKIDQNDNSSNNIVAETYCLLEDYSYESKESEQLAEISNSQKMVLYILKVSSQPGTKHSELFFEKEIVNKNQIKDGEVPNTIEVHANYINEQEESDTNNENYIQETEAPRIYNLLNNIAFTTDESSPAGYNGITWQIKNGNQVGFKTIEDEIVEFYSVDLSIGKTYKNYSIILAALTNLIMPQYKRRVEIEDLNRNFWVISQNLTMLNKFMIGLQDGIGAIFKDIFSEIIGLWDNIYSIWKSIFYLDGKINNFDRELNEIGIATSKVKVKIGYENTFYHEDWSRNQEIIKKLFYFNEKGQPTNSVYDVLNDNTLMLKNENYYFKKGDTKFFGIYPLLYKDTIECKYNLSGEEKPVSETASIVSLPINSTIHPDRITELKKNNKMSEYINNESEIINNIFMDGIGSNGLPYDQTYNSKDNKLGEIIRIERKFGNIKAEDVLEKVRSKNFVLLGYYLQGENKAIDTLSTIINPFMTLLQYLVDLLQKSQQIISQDTTNSTISAINLGIIANTDFRFCTSVTNDIYYVPTNVINSYYFLKDLGIIESSDCIIFSVMENYSSAFNLEQTTNIFNNTLKENFWKIFYKIYKYIYDNLYKVEDGEEPRTYAYHINERTNEIITDFNTFVDYKIACNKASFLPFNQFLLQPTEYTIAVNDSEFDIDVINMYKYDLERFILSNDILQDNGNVTFCPIYVLFKNMKEFFNKDLSDKKFYYTYTNENGTETSGDYKVVFPNDLLKDLNINPTINNEDGTSETLSTLAIFDLVFKDFKKIKWDLLSADIIPDHFLQDAKTKTDDLSTYDCSVYKGDEIDIKKALIEKMDKSAFFNEGKKGCFGTSHLYPWKNCFGLWFEFVGEPTNTGRPIIDAEIQSYTHNMCQGNKIIPYPESIMNTGIILSQYNTYNLDITVPIMNVAGYPFDYILRFGKPYPNIVSMLYRKLNYKYDNAVIYDHMKELNNSANYYYCKYPFVNNISSNFGSFTNTRPNTKDYTFDELVYPVDGYYGHETAGQEYGIPYERMYNYIYDVAVSNKIGTIYRRRKQNSDITEYPNYNNYFGYTYKDCQKYTISSTDLVNVMDNANQEISTLVGGRTLWKNINNESQLIANISFLNSSTYNQHIGLYVSKDTTDNNYGISQEIPEEQEKPTITPPSEQPPGENNTLEELTIDRPYSGYEWCMPPKFQDYFETGNRADINEIFTCEKLGDLQLKWYSGKNVIRYLDDINNLTGVNNEDGKNNNGISKGNITLIPRYIGTKTVTSSGYIIDVYHFTIKEADKDPYKFLATRINHKHDANTEYPAASNYPANIFTKILNPGEENKITLDNKKIGGTTTIINVDIWQGRIDLFCWFNHYTATTESKNYVFDFKKNNFNILGEVEEDYSQETHTYTLKIPTVDYKDTTDNINAGYKNYYRTYEHYLKELGNDNNDDKISYIIKNNLYLNLKEYDGIDNVNQHINKYVFTQAEKDKNKNLVPIFNTEKSRDKRPFSNRMCGWDVTSK